MDTLVYGVRPATNKHGAQNKLEILMSLYSSCNKK